MSQQVNTYFVVAVIGTRPTLYLRWSMNKHGDYVAVEDSLLRAEIQKSRENFNLDELRREYGYEKTEIVMIKETLSREVIGTKVMGC